MKSSLIFILFLIFAVNSYALVAELNLGISQSAFTRTTDQNVGRSINSVGIYANLGKSDSAKGFLMGWYVSSITNTNNFAGVLDQTLTSSDMGPSFRWHINSKLLSSITYTYGIICKGNYSDGSVDEKLDGTSHFIKFEIIESYISEKFLIGLALNYYTASYKSSVISAVQSDIDYKNTWTYPSLTLSYRSF